MINFRTDLALERRDLYKKAHNISDEIHGLETEKEEKGKKKRTRSDVDAMKVTQPIRVSRTLRPQ